MKRIRRVLRLGGVERNVEEELRYHFERTVEDLMMRGSSRQAAEAEAVRRFGDVGAYRRELEVIDEGVAQRRRWQTRWDALSQSFQYALRSLARSPGLTAGVIVAFALGIGANLTMYGIVDRLLLRAPDHIVAPDEVKRIYVSENVPFMSERFTGASMSYPDYRALRGVSAFADVAAIAPRSITIGAGLDAVEKSAVYATANYFGLLGVQPVAGRFYSEADDRVGGPAQAVLSWQAWQRDHAGSRDAIGRTIDFGTGAYEIIGVAPRNFTGIDLAAVDYWIPFHVVRGQTGGSEWLENHGEQFFVTVARLRPGATEQQAMQEATAAWIAGRRGTEFDDPSAQPQVLLTSVLSARGPDAPPESVVARLLLAVSLVVLLIAAVNIANLLLARSLKRRREIAVRLALGISRRRLIGQIMLEGLLLAFAGGAAAVVLALWARDVVGGVLLPDVAWSDGVNGRIIAAAALLSLVAGAASSLAPALQAAHGTSATLRESSGAGAGRRAIRLRMGLSLVQTALSVLLLIGAGLFVRSLERVRHVDYGFDAERIVYATPRMLQGTVPVDEMPMLMERGQQALLRVPGVRAVGAAHSLPFHSFRTTRVRAQGIDSIPVPESGGPYVFEVSAGFHEAMGIDIVAGRGFQDSDAGAAGPVTLINESMAAALWPGESPLGRCLYIGVTPDRSPQDRCSEIVGVVEDARRQEVADVVTLQYYVPLAQKQMRGSARVLVIRVERSNAETLTGIRRALLATDSRIRYVEAEPLMTLIDPYTRSWKLGATLFTVFGLLALTVASIGLYSVLSFDVAQRTREIGVRSALGASRRAVVALVAGSAARITLTGMALGTLAAVLLAARIEPLLFETSSVDAVTIIAVLVMLGAVAACASALPAWRAARVEPSVALRAE